MEYKKLGKYALFVIGIILLIMISIKIEFVNAVVSGTTWSTFSFLQNNGSQIGTAKSGHTIQNISFINVTTHNVRTQNIALGTIAGVAKYFPGPSGSGAGSTTGNGTFITSNFSIPKKAFQAINGTWEVSILGSCSVSGATARVQFILFKLNSTGEYNLTATQNAASPFKGAVNATLADACGTGASSTAVSQNLSVQVPAQFDTGFTNLTGNDRIGVRIAILQQSTTAASYNISMNNTGSYLKVPNVTFVPIPFNYNYSYMSINQIGNYTIFNLESDYIQINVSTGDDINLSKTYDYLVDEKNGGGIQPYFSFTMPDTAAAQSYKNKTLNINYTIYFNNNIAAKYTNPVISLNSGKYGYELIYWCVHSNDTNSLIGTVDGNIYGRTLIDDYTLRISVRYNLNFDTLTTDSIIKCYDPIVSQGANNANTFGNDGAAGNIAWVNPSNAQTSNNVYANVSLALDAVSQALNATNFQFKIPEQAIIKGINVTIERKSTVAGGIADVTVYLIESNGTYGTTNRANVATWGTTDFYQTYGNETDLWGETLNATDINDPDFGVSIVVNNGGTTRSAQIDHIRMQVYYDSPAPYINFTNPTPINGTTVGNLSTLINISVVVNTSLVNNYLGKMIFNWNTTNYSVYDQNLILMYNFNNVSAIGENESKIVDVSPLARYNATCPTNLCPRSNTTNSIWNGFKSFNGTNAGINNQRFINTTLSKVSLNGGFTIEAWAKITTSTGYHWIYGEDGGSGFFLGRSTAGQYMHWSANDVGLGGKDEPNAPFDVNIWYYVAVTWDGTSNTTSQNLKLYINGTQYANRTATSTTFGAGNILIGKRLTSEHWVGDLDEIRIWNRTLSSKEINQSYHANLYKYTQNNFNYVTNQTVTQNGTYTYYAAAGFRDSENATNFTETRTLCVNTSGGSTIDCPAPVVSTTNCLAGTDSSNASTHCATNFTVDQKLGAITWTNPINSYDSNDIYSTSVLLLGQQSYYLKTNNFTWNIPSGNTIQGVQVCVERKAGLLSAISDTSVRLAKGDVFSADRSGGGTWNNADNTTCYGSNTTDLWGFPSIRNDEINSSNFSFAISVSGAIADTASIDAINMSVYYFMTPSANSCSNTVCNFNCYDNCTISSTVACSSGSLNIGGGGGNFTILSSGRIIARLGGSSRGFSPANMCRIYNFGVIG